MPKSEEKKERRLLTGVLAAASIALGIVKILKDRQNYVCPDCGHIIAYKSPYCWYCKVPLDWKSTPAIFQEPLGAIAIVVITIISLIFLLGVYPITHPGEIYVETAKDILLFFGGFLLGKRFSMAPLLAQAHLGKVREQKR